MSLLLAHELEYLGTRAFMHKPLNVLLLAEQLLGERAVVFFVSARTNKRHHHHLAERDIDI